jgi:sugar lactone lactonase YvrE
LLLPLAFALLMLIAGPAVVHAFVNNQESNLVLGQNDLTSSAPEAPPTGLTAPSAVAFDSSGNLWVADWGNSRVLEFKAPFTTGEAASLVIGHPDFTSSGSATTSTGLTAPSAVAFDPSGNLWVADWGNNRILEFKAPFTTGEAASLVIGQTDFTRSGGRTTSAGLAYPSAVAFDSSGNLWVADSGNNRILEFEAPFTAGEAASLLMGQPDLTSNASATTSTGLNNPTGLAFDSSGNLWVADSGNNRMLEFKAPFTTGEAASLVIGQTDFTSSGSATTSTGLFYPSAVVFDSSGNLWVADSGNNRILEFEAPFTTGEAASLLIGQPDLTSSSSATTSTGLNNPTGLAFDSSGNFWVADQYNNRVIEFKAPFTTGEAASLVIGQTDFTSGIPEVASSGLAYPSAVAFDSSGNLWVADQYNNRVLEFTAPFTTGKAASLVIGQTDFTSSGFATTSTGLNSPSAVAFDSSGNLWVADSGNERVLEFEAPFTTGEAASLVIGQTDFASSGSAITSTGLFYPSGLAFDSSGNLWVVDSDDCRVLEFTAPFTIGEAASLVIGQTDFTSSGCETTSTGLRYPSGLAFDPSGNLWVVDSGNNRILEFTAPFTTGKAASLVIGQTDFTSGGWATTSTGLTGPIGLAFDSGNLWVADYWNSRVLEFTAPFTTGEAASLVLGQPDLTSSGRATTSTGLSNPSAVALDSGNLWVADSSNNRVLEYQTFTLSCSHGSLVVGATVTCKATVVGSGFAPTGRVAWSSSSAGTFSSASCKLSTHTTYSTCSVEFTPTVAGSSVVLTASYGGDLKNFPSAGTYSLAVTTRTAKTTVSCMPRSAVAGSSTVITCEARVNGYSPTGTVSWSQSGTGSVSLSSTTCTLTRGKSLTTGTCSVTITGTAAGKVILQATYGGDSNNKSSSKTATLTIEKATQVTESSRQFGRSR